MIIFEYGNIEANSEPGPSPFGGRVWVGGKNDQGRVWVGGYKKKKLAVFDVLYINLNFEDETASFFESQGKYIPQETLIKTYSRYRGEITASC